MEGLNFNVKEVLDKLNSYIASLTQNEKIGWIMICAGIIFLVIGLILW